MATVVVAVISDDGYSGRGGADGSAGVLGGENSRDVSMNEGTIKTPIPKCRLYW